jgi:ribosomal subunit interface protein
MKLEGITAKNMELTPAIEACVLKRIAKLQKIVQKQKPATIRVEVGKPPSQRGKKEGLFYAEFNAIVQDQHFNVKKVDLSIYKAIETVRASMHQQIMKWKKRELGAERKRGILRKQMLQSGYSDK